MRAKILKEMSMNIYKTKYELKNLIIRRKVYFLRQPSVKKKILNESNKYLSSKL